MYHFFHHHQWTEWERQKPHAWDHAEYLVRYCRTCAYREYELIYLHCPKKKIKGEYCEWCKEVGHEWDRKIVSMDKMCYDALMENAQKPRMGRPIDMAALKKALEYREKGLGLLETARVMKKDPTQIVRWYAYIDKKKVQV